MSVYKDGTNWQDRILNHYPPASDGERYYKIVKPDGTVVAEAAKLELLNTVLPGNEGTPVNATNLNTVLAALGHVKQQYSKAKLQEPYLESLLAYMDFNRNLTPVVGSFTGENDGCSFSAGPHSGSGSIVGAGATTGVTLSDKVVPFGAKTVRFRLKMSSLAAQTLLDETSISTANYGTCITIDAAGKIRVRLMQAGSTPVDITAGTAIKTGQWNDFCFAWDGSTEAGRVRLYLNGRQVAMGTAAAKQDMGHAATNNTVLLNQAPVASSGGTAAMSDLEIYNEARYQDALMLEQKGFSLFDGAKLRVYVDYLPSSGTEILLNVNEQGYVPVEAAAIKLNAWCLLMYTQAADSFMGCLAELGRLNSDLFNDKLWKGGTFESRISVADGSSNDYSCTCGGKSSYGTSSTTYTCVIGSGIILKNGLPWPYPEAFNGQITTQAKLREYANMYIIGVYDSYNSETRKHTYSVSGPYKIRSSSTLSGNTSGYTAEKLRSVKQTALDIEVSFDTFVNTKDETMPAAIAKKALRTEALPLSSISRIYHGSYVGTGAMSKTIYVGKDAKLIFFESHSFPTNEGTAGTGNVYDYPSTLMPLGILSANINGVLDKYYSGGEAANGLLTCNNQGNNNKCKMSFDPQSGNLYLVAVDDARYCRNAQNIRYDYIVIA